MLNKIDKQTLILAKQRRTLMLFGGPLIILVLFGGVDSLITTEDLSLEYSYYSYIHKLWIIIIPFNTIFLLANYNNFIIYARTYLLVLFYMLITFAIGSITAGIGMYYFTSRPDLSVITIIYLCFISFTIFAGIYYYKQWKIAYSSSQLKQYKIDLAKNDYKYNINRIADYFKIEPNKKKSFFTKLEENPLFIKFSLIVLFPIASVFGGSGNDVGVGYVLLGMVIFIFPTLLRTGIQHYFLYKLIIKLEKEENIQILTGIWEE